MEQMREILKSIHDNGEMSFQPKDDSPAAVKEFQAIAKRIRAAHEKGYLVNANFLVSNMEETAGYTLNVIVNGGLTFEGEQFLEAQQKEAEKPALVSTDKPADLIKFEPRIFWLKFEGNEIYRRLKRWWYGKKQQKN